MIQGKGYRIQSLFTLRWLQLAFPYGDAMPAHFSKFALLLLVSLLVPANLRHPEVMVRIRYLAALRTLNYALCIMNYALNIVPMPEASVDEDASAILAKYQVRMPRQPLMIQSIPETTSPQPFTHNHLRLRILRTNARHNFVTLLWREVVHISP